MLPCYWQYEKIYLEEHKAVLSVSKDELVMANVPTSQAINPPDTKQSLLLTVNNRGRTLAVVAGNNPISSRDAGVIESYGANSRLKHMISVQKLDEDHEANDFSSDNASLRLANENAKK